MNDERRRDVEMPIDVRPENEIGTYANFLSAWHSPYEFTLDFCQTQQPRSADPEDDSSPIVVTCTVVARIKLPVTLIFDVITALNETMTLYENELGEIRRPGEGGDE